MKALRNAPRPAQPAPNPLETSSAVQLDNRGRLALPVLKQEAHFTNLNGRPISAPSFTQYIDPTDRHKIEAIYLNGVRSGQLYRFIDTAIETSDGLQPVTLLLYYHPITQQGWLFIEAKASPNAIPEMSLAA